MEGRNGFIKRVTAVILTLALILTLVPVSNTPVEAAVKKTALSKKSVTVTVGKKVTVSLKNVNKKVTWKVVSGKKFVSIKKSGKYKQKLTIKGKKVGSAKIKAVYGTKKYTLKVKIKKKSASSDSTTSSTSVEDKPNTSTESQTMDITEKPSEQTVTEKVTEVPTKDNTATEEATEVSTAENTTEEKTTEASTTENTTTEETTEASTTENTTTEETTEASTEASTTEQVFYEEPEVEEVPKNVEVDSYMHQIDAASSSTVTTGAAEGIEKLFDGDVNTKMCTMDGFPLRISWQMDRAIVLKKYTLTTANDSATYSYRNPKSWHLYGSNNGTSWTQIDTVTDSGIEAKNFESYTYETDIQESFQYYLLQIESNGTNYYGFQLSEISMYGDVAEISYNIGEDLSSYFDSVYADATTAEGYNNEIPVNLFDGDVTTKMYENSKEFSVAWKMTQETTVYSYSLTTANDNESYTGRNPKSWILYGSTDGNNWEKIDVVNESGMEDVNYTTYSYTVDKVGSYRYYKLEVKALYGSSCQLSEISLKGAALSTSKYDILFTGDWDEVTVDGYLEELTKLFYNSYPRLYQRWGNGTEPTTITFKADKNYDGVAYCQGTTVCVSTQYANTHPNDIGFFSHEITHSVQQYSGKLNYGDDVAWWTENMANYGGFRYFHWSNPKYVQVYEAADESLQDWGYEQYGNNKWFFAYMDFRYPTKKNADGTISYGLIDSINTLIKNNDTGSTYTDDPYDTTTPFNNVVKQITGYDCIESLRLRYVEELKQGTWTFKGFADYEDNWVTEDIEGIANPEYPMIGEKIHGNITAAQLGTAVTSGTNLCSGATVYDCSGYTNDTESPQMLIDGNLDTKWCATSSNVTNGQYKLNGVAHWIQIDLGAEKTFNTYTLYNTQSKEGFGNVTEWEILISNDGKNWISVDYQGSNNSAVASFDIGQQTARYVMIKVFTPDNGVGTLRLYDFQLYNR